MRAVCARALCFGLAYALRVLRLSVSEYVEPSLSDVYLNPKTDHPQAASPPRRRAGCSGGGACFVLLEPIDPGGFQRCVGLR